ncbi:hypothetical protein PVK06_021476 [Gossypium arboreum]|uniref:Uncharacterized protein n=1 Tax=Gossypium arboreum TaxID=29729 RepID=A0ABR0PQ33_GOSAR|nr:hypothetical protein PVK06_021476 [Gossypium arboreum]
MSLGFTVQYFGNIAAPYDWLLPGWIVEERFVPFGYRGRGRIYKGFSLHHVRVMKMLNWNKNVKTFSCVSNVL